MNDGKDAPGRIKGMDFIDNLFEEGLLKEMNLEYGKLLIALNGSKNNSLTDELAEMLKTHEKKGLKYSTAPVITEKGWYVRFVFRKRFVILFPRGAEAAIRLCKLRRELIKTRGVGTSSGNYRMFGGAKFQEIRREMVNDEDFFEFENILKNIIEKMSDKIAAKAAI